MRICLVSAEYPPAGTGGIAAYVYQLAHGLAAEGHDVSVIAGPAHQRSESALSTEGVSLYGVRNREFWLPAPVRGKGLGLRMTVERSFAVDRTIARLERSQGPFDLVEMPNWGAEALCYCLHPRAPLVIRLSTPLAQVNQLRRNSSSRLGLRLLCHLEALPARHAAGIIAHSESIANFCADLYRIPAAKSHVIPLGVPLPCASLEKGTTEATILYVGRLERRKGIDRLLQAIPAVIREAPHCKFVIAGADTGDAPNGSSYQDYLASFATSEAREATTFLGHVEEGTRSQLYADCDIFVAPSLSESFGLIYLEAMAHAKPVVAFHSGAAPEVVNDGETGILAEPDNISELGDALIRLAENAAMRQEMGQRGYARARAKFSVQRMVEETIACYRKVVSSS